MDNLTNNGHETSDAVGLSLKQMPSIDNEVDCDEPEETMRSASSDVGNAPVAEEHFEDDSCIEKSRRANPSGDHAAIDTVGKCFEDDPFIEKSRRANPSGNHAVDNGFGLGGNAPVRSNFEDDPLAKKRQIEKPSCISCLDENPPSQQKPSHISCSEESPASNDNLPPADLDPMTMPAPPMNDVVPQHRPGAHSHNAEASGSNLQRLDQPRFSLIGVEHANDNEEDDNVNSDEEDTDVHNLSDYEDDMDAQSDNDGATEVEVPTNAMLPRPSNTDLAVAAAIENCSSSLAMVEAQELDSGVLQRQEIGESKRKRCRMAGCVIVGICSIVLALSLGLSIGRTEKSPSTNQPTVAPTHGPRRPPPPMDNLELSCDELPEKTRDHLEAPVEEFARTFKTKFGSRQSVSSAADPCTTPADESKATEIDEREPAPGSTAPAPCSAVSVNVKTPGSAVSVKTATSEFSAVSLCSITAAGQSDVSFLPAAPGSPLLAKLPGSNGAFASIEPKPEPKSDAKSHGSATAGVLSDEEKSPTAAEKFDQRLSLFDEPFEFKISSPEGKKKGGDEFALTNGVSQELPRKCHHRK